MDLHDMGGPSKYVLPKDTGRERSNNRDSLLDKHTESTNNRNDVAKLKREHVNATVFSEYY